MGNNTPIQISQRIKNAMNPSLHGWQITQKGDMYNVWKNKSTNQQIQQYTYNASDKFQLDKIKDLFYFRFQKQYIITTNQICSNFYGANVFVERIVIRLNLFKKIKFPSILHVYQACLQGFYELYSKFGSFPINQQMVAVNTQGRIKVWINSTFGFNHAQYGISYRNETEIVKQIIKMIDNYSDHSSQPENIKKYLDKQKTFQSTINQLYDFAEKYGILIPSRIDISQDLQKQKDFRITSQNQLSDYDSNQKVNYLKINKSFQKDKNEELCFNSPSQLSFQKIDQKSQSDQIKKNINVAKEKIYIPAPKPITQLKNFNQSKKKNKQSPLLFPYKSAIQNQTKVQSASFQKTSNTNNRLQLYNTKKQVSDFKYIEQNHTNQFHNNQKRIKNIFNNKLNNHFLLKQSQELFENRSASLPKMNTMFLSNRLQKQQKNVYFSKSDENKNHYKNRIPYEENGYKNYYNPQLMNSHPIENSQNTKKGSLFKSENMTYVQKNGYIYANKKNELKNSSSNIIESNSQHKFIKKVPRPFNYQQNYKNQIINIHSFNNIRENNPYENKNQIKMGKYFNYQNKNSMMSSPTFINEPNTIRRFLHFQE